MLKEFDLNSVQVTDPYCVNAFEKVTEYLLSLEPDRLLAGFKAVSEGRDPQTEPNLNLYRGWEDSWSLLRGHTMGHYLTAIAQAYRQTKNRDQDLSESLAERINYTVNQLKSFQDRSPSGCLLPLRRPTLMWWRAKVPVTSGFPGIPCIKSLLD